MIPNGFGNVQTNRNYSLTSYKITQILRNAARLN